MTIHNVFLDEHLGKGFKKDPSRKKVDVDLTDFVDNKTTKLVDGKVVAVTEGQKCLDVANILDLLPYKGVYCVEGDLGTLIGAPTDLSAKETTPPTTTANTKYSRRIYSGTWTGTQDGGILSISEIVDNDGVTWSTVIEGRRIADWQRLDNASTAGGVNVSAPLSGTGVVSDPVKFAYNKSMFALANNELVNQSDMCQHVTGGNLDVPFGTMAKLGFSCFYGEAAKDGSVFTNGIPKGVNTTEFSAAYSPAIYKAGDMTATISDFSGWQLATKNEVIQFLIEDNARTVAGETIPYCEIWMRIHNHGMNDDGTLMTASANNIGSTAEAPRWLAWVRTSVNPGLFDQLKTLTTQVQNLGGVTNITNVTQLAASQYVTQVNDYSFIELHEKPSFAAGLTNMLISEVTGHQDFEMKGLGDGQVALSLRTATAKFPFNDVNIVSVTSELYEITNFDKTASAENSKGWQMAQPTFYRELEQYKSDGGKSTSVSINYRVGLSAAKDEVRKFRMQYTIRVAERNV